MRRLFICGVFIAGAVLPARAQETPPAPPPVPPTTQTVRPGPPPATTRKPRVELRGERKMRYLVKQVSLDTEQKKHAEGLFEVFKAELDSVMADPAKLLEQIGALHGQLQAAEKSGDKAKADAIRAEMKKLAPVEEAEANFWRDFEQQLRPEQKQQLDKARKRLSDRRDVPTVQPADVFDIVSSMNLNDEQKPKLEDAMIKARERAAKLSVRDESANERLVEHVIGQVQVFLTQDQARELNLRLEQLKPDPPPPGAARPAASQPARKP